MKYEYLFVNGYNKDLESKVNKYGAEGWRLHSIRMGESFWDAVMEKVIEDDGTKRN